LEYSQQVLFLNLGFIPYYLVNKNKFIESEEILPDEPKIIDEAAMIKLTNKIKNAIIHYIMISWDEIHKNDQPPVITKIIDDEIEIINEKIETNTEIPQDLNENNLITIGEQVQPKSLPADTINAQREINLKMNERILFFIQKGKIFF
jgi:hypothetical protein